MLSVINACSSSIDSLDAVCEDILSQLKDKKLLKNSVGIIGCHSDYVDYGVIQAISKSLAFDMIGCSTLGSATNQGGGMEHLALTILTSDEIEFTTILSDTIHPQNYTDTVEQAYGAVKKSLGQDPNLIFMFAPLLRDVVGDQILRKLDQISGGIPVFGTLSSDSSLRSTSNYVFKNGDFDLRKMALLAMRGNIHPRFFVTAFPKDIVPKSSATVTATEGYLVTAINDMQALDYFAAMGINVSERMAVASMVPCFVDLNDGTEPVIHSIYDMSETGVYFAGMIPKGSRIVVAAVDRNAVMETAKTTLRRALDDVEKNGAHAIIAIPCIGRALMLSPNVEAEMITSLEVVGNTIPFSLIYSGGEICPVYNQQHKLINRFHNLTYTVVVF